MDSASTRYTPHRSAVPSGIKRSFAQHATASALKNHHTSGNSSSSAMSDPNFTKVPRVDADSDQLGPTSRHITAASPLVPRHLKASHPPSPGHSTTNSPHRPYKSSGLRHPRSSSSPFPPRSMIKGKGRALDKPMLDLPFHDQTYIAETYRLGEPLKKVHEETPKSALGNWCMQARDEAPSYESSQGIISHEGHSLQVWRTTVRIELSEPIVGIGDSTEKKDSERLAALSAVYQLNQQGLLEVPRSLRQDPETPTSVLLSDGQTSVNYDTARNFMDYYCRIYKFDNPDLTFNQLRERTLPWEAVMTVSGRRIGIGKGPNKKAAQIACYLDVTQYLESCDNKLWLDFVEAAKSGRDLGLAPKVLFQMNYDLHDDIRDLCREIRGSQLYKNRPAVGCSGTETSVQVRPPAAPGQPFRHIPQNVLVQKSKQLLERQRAYLTNRQLEKMRWTRMNLPVYSFAEKILSCIRDNDVTICMAATGSGKTTQVPQLILDEYIDKGQGAICNIICTQPRRLAAISVADRVAKERGEVLGQSVGYQVRFEHKLPEQHGSITFCTTGIFLKRMHTALSESSELAARSLDNITHVVVDEVHERDVDTDILLVVLKRLLADRKARKKPLSIVLMSATINPTLFQNYFLDDHGSPAQVVEVPGRAFPVAKHFLEDYVPYFASGPLNWVFNQESVTKYMIKEMGIPACTSLGIRLPQRYKGQTSIRDHDEELELPYPLIAATVSHVLQKTDSGHVLVFLPGWDEIMATQRALQEPVGPLGVNFNDRSKFSIHLLHSTIPLAEQQVIFDPPPPGIRRVILATNIAETSVTIPDVVYVVDTAKVKEQRYDPDRHMSSLVSAWVGSSNVNQRAGRAGRHRPGEYFGILGRDHASSLHAYQTVEMKRVDLSNVVMHVKALNFPGMTVEEVLAACIEPPPADRVSAAMKSLLMVGALDKYQSLTSLGRVLLQLPVDAQVGRLVLFGSFFRCLDPALTIAAILTNRDPFVSPMHLKREASERKNSWTPQEFRSDVLATLQAYNAWWAMQSRGEYMSANRFCVDNFLAKPTLLLIQKIKTHLLQSLYHAGVIAVSAGGRVDNDSIVSIPPELNTNRDSLPLLAALIAVGTQPKFAIRTGEKSYRTQLDRIVFMHPSSVNNRKRIQEFDEDDSPRPERQLFAFSEKRQNVSVVGQNPMISLVTTTRLDPLTYMLFGAYKLESGGRGLECDGWLPIIGDRHNLDALEDVQQLKNLMNACMLRVFEGITMSQRQHNRQLLPLPPREKEQESDEEEEELKDYSLSQQEILQLDFLTRDIVQVLNKYHDEQLASQSRYNSRPATPFGSPRSPNLRLPGTVSGYSTPVHRALSFSRPNTPSGLSRRLH